MKLILVLSVIAYGYADKLDRTYLPPPNAASAGGNAGLMAPFGSQPSEPAYNQASSGFTSSNAPNQPQGSFAQASFGQSKGAAGKQFSVPETNQGFGAPAFLEQRPERPQAEADKNAEILKYENENNGENFAYSFETSNGISAEESGVAVNGVQAQGGFSYTGDDGQTYSVKYTADENGYLPEGEHLPTPHPIPEEILKSIEQNARAAAAGTQEGAYKPEEYENKSQAPQQYNAKSFNQGQTQGEGKAPQQYGAPNTGLISSSALQNSNQPQRPASQFNQGATQGSAQGPAQFGEAESNIARGSQNGYQYNHPQASFAASNQGSTQYRPHYPEQAQPMQYSAAQSGSQSSVFPRPSGQVFKKSSKPDGAPSGSNQPARPQVSFDAPSQKQSVSAKPAAFPKPGSQGFDLQPQGPVPARPGQNQFATQAPSFSRPSVQRPQASFNAPSQGFAAAPKSQMPIQAPYQYNRPAQSFGQSAAQQGSFEQSAPQQGSFKQSTAQQGPFGQSTTQQGSSDQPKAQQGPFRPSQSQQGSLRQSQAQQNSFGQSADQQRLSSPNAQSNFVAKTFNQGSGSSFGAPRQPPSFSPQEGYKY